MPAATILIPTHERPESLRQSIASAQSQTLGDFELFVVGDGVRDATRAVMIELMAADRRIRFFDYPKGPRKGEIHRHAALKEATGRFVAYLGDDDLWLENHLLTLDQLLRRADFGHTLHVGAGAHGGISVLAADLGNPAFRSRMLTELFNRFDFTFGGHTLAAYRRLPFGWRTTPPEFPWTDLYMWRQFLAEPWCRAQTAMVPTGICTQSSGRPHATDAERAAELARWRGEFAKPSFHALLWRRTFKALAIGLRRRELRPRSVGSLLRSAARLLRYGVY
jgi:glycosyltransferase involved in cell wall biosynthesis